jgi:DNA polymerase-2
VSRGIILQPTYRVQRGVPVVHLHGRLESGRPFLVIDDRHRPYFFLHARHIDAARALPDAVIEETALTDLHGEPVARVTMPLPGAVPPLRDQLRGRGIATFEADVRFAYRYLIDRGIRASAEISGGKQREEGALVYFENPDVTPSDYRPTLTHLSLDLETTPDASQIFSAALAGEGVEEVHLVATRAVKGASIYKDEASLLKGLALRIREIDPDVLLGWNVVGFDLRVFNRRCVECKLTGTEAQLGRTAGEIRFEQNSGFTRQERALIPGRIVLDGIPLVRDALRLPDYRLETVARAVLDRGKLIDSEAPDSAAEISRLYAEEPEALVRYNLEDARLVLDILEHEGLLELTLERSLLSGMPLDRVGASIASFDRLYLPELRKHGVVAPNVDLERERVGLGGGAVLDSEPGVFRNVAVFDFKSLYPSLIRSFNLDPLAHARGEREAEKAIRAPNGALFSRESAILPATIERFMQRREAARERGDAHASQAIKIMMNAMYGVLGSSACRFFDRDVSNAITSFGQQTLAWTAEAFEAEGVRVFYGDTDSVFVRLDPESSPEEAEREAQQLRDRVQLQIADRVRQTYEIEPKLELELDHLYDRFFLPRLRRSETGSKKRYAGWKDGKLSIAGLESVRRDWPELARRLQMGLLERLFRDEDPLPFVAEVARATSAGELDSELVYVKRVRKRSLDQYTASSPPHVQAARKAGGTQRGVIRYVITHTGPEPVLPGRELPPGIDHRHYLEKVLRPIADAVLVHLDLSFDEAMGAPRQMKLF